MSPKKVTFLLNHYSLNHTTKLMQALEKLDSTLSSCHLLLIDQAVLLAEHYRTDQTEIIALKNRVNQFALPVTWHLCSRAAQTFGVSKPLPDHWVIDPLHHIVRCLLESDLFQKI